MTVTRPGILPETLARHDIVHVDEAQAESLIGLRRPGTWIPYFGISTVELIVNGRRFGRIRADHGSNGARYLQARESGCHLYIPNGCPFSKELVVCEGEFKALSLVEAKIRAVGIGGITCAMNDDQLIPELAALLAKYPIETVYFLGDSDTSFNYDFAREACKLAKCLPERCKLKLPRMSINAGKGIDDAKEKCIEKGEDFLAFWNGLVEKAHNVTRKTNAGHLAVKLAIAELPAVSWSAERDEYITQLVALGSRLEPVPLDRLAQAAKNILNVGVTAFKANSARRDHDDAFDRPLPTIFTDGQLYYRPYEDGFEAITAATVERMLRRMGFRHRTALGCELTPLEICLDRIHEENRVDYAGIICGRPAGYYRENGVRVLCTVGPKIIEAKEGDWTALQGFLFSLLGNDRDPFAPEQFAVFSGWILRARHALRNPNQHLPGQMLTLVGPRDCGKSLLQSVITRMLGGREADPSLWVVRGNDFNSNLWRAEHLRLGDEELDEDGRYRHEMRDRIKKMITTDLFPLHCKHQEARDFRPVGWRVSCSCNDDSGSLGVLPPLSEDFLDKIIYLKCYPPVEPYHDGSEEAAREFWDELIAGIPGFLYVIENTPLPEEHRASRFYVKAFHHPEVVQLIADASPLAAIGELIKKWVTSLGGEVEGSAMELFEKLKQWYREGFDEKSFSAYSSNPMHFGHQLRHLKDLLEWSQRLSKSHRYGGSSRSKQTIWKISLL